MQNVKVPYLTLDEQATGDVGNPDAGHQRLFVDSTDNKPKLKNSSGTVSSLGGTPSGTSFPGSPAASDQFYRTDRNLLYYYDGARWLSAQIFRETFFPSDNSNPTGTDGAATGAWVTKQGDNGIWVISIDAVTLILSPNDGSNYWTIRANWRNQANVNTVWVSATTAADTAVNWYNKSMAVNALLDSTARHVLFTVHKTGGPGAIYSYPAIVYRLVG